MNGLQLLCQVSNCICQVAYHLLVTYGQGPLLVRGLEVVALVSATILAVFSNSATELIVSSSAKAKWALLIVGTCWRLRDRWVRGYSVSNPHSSTRSRLAMSNNVYRNGREH